MLCAVLLDLGNEIALETKDNMEQTADIKYILH